MNETIETPILVPGTVAVTVGQLLNSNLSLSRLASQPMRGVQAMRLARTMKAVAVELQAFEAARLELCNKYGTESEDGKNFIIDPLRIADFEGEFAEMVSEPLTVPGTKLTESDLAEIQISVADFSALEWLFSVE